MWTAVENGWNSFKQPFVDAWNGFKESIIGIGKDMWKGIEDAFNQGKTAVETIWEGVKKAAVSPIKFVIVDVINNGLIGGVNGLAEKIGLKNLIPKIPVPAFLNGYARGGILPGYSSWRDGDDQLVPM